MVFTFMAFDIRNGIKLYNPFLMNNHALSGISSSSASGDTAGGTITTTTGNISSTSGNIQTPNGIVSGKSWIISNCCMDWI